MPAFSNGYVPYSVVSVVLASGTDENGYWEFRCTPSFAARWAFAKQYALARFGRTIYIRTGWNVYRPIDSQKVARTNACAAGNCAGAAYPGSSSHGGNWNGRDCLAVDVDPNGLSWDQVDEAMEAAGFSARMITEAMSGIAGGERWHYIDFNAFGAVPSFESSTPFPPARPQEDDPMLMLIIGGAHFAALGEGIFRHFTGTDPRETIKNLSRSADDWQNVSYADLPALLYTYGCDLNIWDIRDGAFVVLDPLRATVASGNSWTATGAVRAAINGLTQPTLDPTPIVEAVKAAIAANPTEADVDEQAIADAVREKFRTDPLA